MFAMNPGLLKRMSYPVSICRNLQRIANKVINILIHFRVTKSYKAMKKFPGTVQKSKKVHLTHDSTQMKKQFKQGFGCC